MFICMRNTNLCEYLCECKHTTSPSQKYKNTVTSSPPAQLYINAGYLNTVDMLILSFQAGLDILPNAPIYIREFNKS